MFRLLGWLFDKSIAPSSLEDVLRAGMPPEAPVQGHPRISNAKGEDGDILIRSSRGSLAGPFANLQPGRIPRPSSADCAKRIAFPVRICVMHRPVEHEVMQILGQEDLSRRAEDSLDVHRIPYQQQQSVGKSSSFMEMAAKNHQNPPCISLIFRTRLSVRFL